MSERGLQIKILLIFLFSFPLLAQKFPLKDDLKIINFNNFRIALSFLKNDQRKLLEATKNAEAVPLIGHPNYL
jgi:hypothetical protein